MAEAMIEQKMPNGISGLDNNQSKNNLDSRCSNSSTASLIGSVTANIEALLTAVNNNEVLDSKFEELATTLELQLPTEFETEGPTSSSESQETQNSEQPPKAGSVGGSNVSGYAGAVSEIITADSIMNINNAKISMGATEEQATYIKDETQAIREAGKHRANASYFDAGASAVSAGMKGVNVGLDTYRTSDLEGKLSDKQNELTQLQDLQKKTQDAIQKGPNLVSSEAGKEPQVAKNLPSVDSRIKEMKSGKILNGEDSLVQQYALEDTKTAHETQGNLSSKLDEAALAGASETDQKEILAKIDSQISNAHEESRKLQDQITNARRETDHITTGATEASRAVFDGLKGVETQKASKKDAAEKTFSNALEVAKKSSEMALQPIAQNEQQIEQLLQSMVRAASAA